jgi:DNA-binding IclR family transcriptional regulator
MNDASDPERYRAPALDKGLDILELLASVDGGLTQIEIAKALGRSANENYRMLDRLVRRGYVLRNEADRYELTLKLFGLAHLHRPIRRLVAQATPLMRELAQRTQQSNHLAVYDPDDGDIPDDLEERLAQIRQRGYEVMPSQQTSGVYNLSAPILSPDGSALAALTCPYLAPLRRPSAPDITDVINKLMQTANVLSRTIGGVVPKSGA